jgi:NNP family nitrate/nitrite transporter-like MFS transporter
MAAIASARLLARLTLMASFIHFLLSFALWMLIGALGVYIAEELELSAAKKSFLVAIPILSGSLLRIPAGLLSDSFGAKRVGSWMLAFLFLPLILGWQSRGLGQLIACGFMLGVAGASFAVALPLSSRWYAADRQGLVMGIAAAGNAGTVIANLLAPRLANQFGWRNVFALAMLPLAVALIAFSLMAKDNRTCPAKRSGAGAMISALKEIDLWWFCFFYSITFGGYVGLSGFLPIFLRDQYSLDPILSGHLTALVALIGSLSRPIGGFLADRFGGARMLAPLLGTIGLSYILVAQSPGLDLMIGLLVVMAVCLGMGNGVVFQLVPQRFPNQIGTVTGVVGAVGGVGGFFLPTLLGSAKQWSGSFVAGFLALGLASAVAAISARTLTALPESWG